MQPNGNPTGVAEQPNADEHNIPKSSSSATPEIIGYARKSIHNESIKLVITLRMFPSFPYNHEANLTHLLEINTEDLNRVINGEQAVSIVRLIHTTDKEIKLNLSAIEQDMGE